MTAITTVEQLNEFVRSKQPRATISGDLANTLNRHLGTSTSLEVIYERKEHRDMNRDVIAVTEVHWLQVGRSRIALDDVLNRAGIA
ncbi:hypothetical protein IU443_28520 [Nocardia farcinica]|uniref:Uncharacterized protein n=1 Tax=Nocardia farcinica TaxID=37329 RepID=A0A0H5PP44_NOCFR|nr:hypothetical protein [Nocardia farcinica]SLG32892.1 Uncharacterised protein [Mycobacteroides abscessus subsp. abscessus]AXK88549.1 hypothetical protein DXT66_25660 [Nocardia farcinica]MBF6393877.1 hypothetical protein [Nocardia farcinica]MBF6540763.1 hypothetical protein [Nocardia farcinica]PFW98851.1 hypothetical protein CJ469_05812 [Nocardia farcinica]